MESIALGTPVLGADIGGIPELVIPGQTGELFTPGDVNSLIATIRRLWKNRHTLHAIPECPFDTAEEYAEKLIRIYRGA